MREKGTHELRLPFGAFGSFRDAVLVLVYRSLVFSSCLVYPDEGDRDSIDEGVSEDPPLPGMSVNSLNFDEKSNPSKV